MSKPVMINNKKLVTYGMAVLLFLSMLIVAREAARLVTSKKIEGVLKNRTVVIDAGHGADDSGKVGINGALEKDINLAIAKRTKALLEMQDIKVIMTREDDEGDYPKTGSNRKMRDMKKRVEMINGKMPALVVSIHQNSFPDERISGAQTFYYRGSEEGERAAKLLQKQLIETLQPEKERVAKEDTG